MPISIISPAVNLRAGKKGIENGHNNNSNGSRSNNYYTTATAAATTTKTSSSTRKKITNAKSTYSVPWSGHTKRKPSLQILCLWKSQILRPKKNHTPLCEHVREPVVVVQPQLAALGEHEQREEGLVPRHPEVEDDRVLLREGPPGGQEEAPAERGRQLPGHMVKGLRSLYREKAY